MIKKDGQESASDFVDAGLPENLPPTEGRIGDALTPMPMSDTIGGDQAGGLKLPPWLGKVFAASPLNTTLTLGLFYTKLRPVTEFVMPTNFSKPKGQEVVHRLRTNLKHFWANYSVIAMVITVISIITSPLLLVVMAIYAFLWSKVLDESFKVHTYTPDKKTKMGVMAVLTVLGFMYFASTTICWSIGSSGFLACVHAAFHLPPAEGLPTVEDDDENLELGFLDNSA